MQYNGEGLQESEFSLSGYNLYSANIGTTKKRGVIIYVDSSFKSCEVNLTSGFEEFLVVKVCLGIDNNTIHLGAFYRSPSSCNENNDSLLSLLDTISETIKQAIIIIGDFNYKNI